MDNQRKAQRRGHDKGCGSYWETIPFMELRKGDLFRLVEPDGTLADGGEEAIAESDPYFSVGSMTKYASFVDDDTPKPWRVPTIECTVVKD